MRYRNTSAAAVLIAVAAVTSCAPPAPSTLPPEQWATYTTADGLLAFDHPDEWTVSTTDPLANDPAGGVSVRVHDGAGRTIAVLDTGLIVDLVCRPGPDRAAYTEYDSVPMPGLVAASGAAQRFVYHSLDPASGPSQATYAVVGDAQQDGQCGLFDFFGLTESSGGRFMGEFVSGQPADSVQFLEEAAAYPQTEEYEDVVRMLTSLRNAG